MRFILLLSAILLVAPIMAQQSINFGLYHGKRVDGPSRTFNSGSGISVEYTHQLVPKFDLRGSIGFEASDPALIYTSPSGDWYSLDDFWIIPIRIGVQRYVYADKAFVFAEPGIGIGFFPFDENNVTKTSINFSYALGGGYRFALNNRRYIQASLFFHYEQYRRVFTFSWISLRAAYGIKWNRKSSS